MGKFSPADRCNRNTGVNPASTAGLWDIYRVISKVIKSEGNNAAFRSKSDSGYCRWFLQYRTAFGTCMSWLESEADIVNATADGLGPQLLLPQQISTV